MDGRHRAIDSTEPLVVRGKGYTPVGLPCAHRPAIASSSHETRRTTVTATLRKSGSIGNLRNLGASSGFQKRLDSQNVRCNRCSCHRVINDIQTSQLHEQYTRQLQQQIYFLELENSFLRQGEQKRIQEKPDSVSRTNNRANPAFEKSLNIYSDYLKQLDGYSSRASQPSPTDELNTQNSDSYDLKSNFATSQSELLQKLEEAYQRESSLEERLKEKIKDHTSLKEENIRLNKQIENFTTGHSKLQECYSRDKRALVEEIVELQRRIDDLTPTLALKESQVAKLESEKDAANNQVRSVTNQLQCLQMKLDEVRREEAAVSKLENERQEEIDFLRRSLKGFEAEIQNYKEKERNFAKDLADLKRELREAELLGKKEKAIAEKALEENSSVIKENSQLCAKISLLELEIEQLQKEMELRKANDINIVELNEAREAEKRLKIELVRLQERLKTEQGRLRTVESEFEEYRKKEEEKGQWHHRTQKELEGLQALSSSLSSENKLLRQDKLTLGDRCDELQNKVRKRDEEIEMLKERCQATYDNYKKILEELERETALQSERAEEYEELVNRVHQLSASLSRDEIQSKNVRGKRQMATPENSPGKNADEQKQLKAAQNIGNDKPSRIPKSK